MMIKKIFILTVLLFYSRYTSFVQDSEGILWTPEIKLTWDDFKGTSQEELKYKTAETTTLIKIDSVYLDKNKVPVFRLGCYFITNESWTITSEDVALEHEQIHFDISELYARKIRKAFDSLNRKRIKDYNVYNLKFNGILDECEKYQECYDSDIYGTNEDVEFYDLEKQKKWMYSVKDQLDKLRDYQYFYR